MGNSKKIRRIRLLMIASQILLMFFVIQWLMVRFDQEKQMLTKELERELRASEDKMLDSLLLKKVVNPIMKGDKRPKVQMYVMTDSVRSNVIALKTKKKGCIDSILPNEIVISGNSPEISEVVVDKRSKHDNIHIKSDFKVEANGENVLSDKLILRSLKVFTNKVADSTKNTKTFNFKFSTFIDSAFIKSDFEGKPITSNFKIFWTDKDSNTNNKGIYISTSINGSSLAVNISKYQIYLIKTLLPQILFGLILLILTGVAFAISFISLKKQMELNIIRNEFVANISHELKTPVATVKVALEAIQTFDLKNEPAKADEYIRIAQAEMNRLEMLVQNVLTSSIYDGASNGFIQPERVSLKSIVDEVTQSMQIRFQQMNAQLTVDTEGFNFDINADRLHVQGVLINLIDNSLKYVEVNPKIAVKLFEENSRVILTVSDNGIGIPDEYISKVFDKFFRVPTQNRHNIKGYGLGLSYASMVMKQHKGTIGVENLKEGGCRFTLSFPKQG